ncbi:phosphatase PAP2 family protein [Sphingomonas sp. LY54]|uniref:phosphatase PAP2 family protein n=1 Tax=Sphingomonas sp. LY54 TaxID=3095343 RepID=UPI002D793293|nr:phosphatase PAP2 family protein [Sphingomonas sp. LY54]WRP29995.1 phosphatase PAP2 family protein [Sphingomonas sp. LY54]
MTAKKKSARAGQALLDADAAAVDAVEPYRHAPPVKALAWYSELGDQPQMLSLSGAVLAAGLVRRDARMARAGGRMIAAHLLATAAKNFVKHRIDRTRPRGAVVARGDHKPKTGRNRAKEETSFPSGHSAGAIAVARAFSREYPEYQGAALAAAGLIALAQIPRCAHYPTDVAAGLALGAAAESAVDRLWPADPGSAASSKAAPVPA